ncbi:MAG TPA: substrate-binding domain-containing protein [Spirochaetia bacterium]|nr:substrate-binding domain-containing protein [Spirochaetia bacterium]
MTRSERVFILCVAGLLGVLSSALFASGQSEKSASAAAQSISSRDQAVVQSAIQANQQRTGPQSRWDGPTSGLKAVAGKKIIYVTSDSRDALQVAWGRAMEEAAGKVGWTVTTLDGQGTVNGWTAAFGQAIASQPDGIVTACDAASIQGPMTDASSRKIPVIGLQAAANPGPDPELHLWDNISSSGVEIGKALADSIIADSNGKGRAIILYDAQNAIAKLKAEAMKAEFAKCASCTLLDSVNSPLAEVTIQMPQLASSWVSRYGTPFYVMTITDSYYDFLVPALRIGGVKPEDAKLVGAGGTVKAYDRIRKGDYQIATVPEPSGLQGYQAIDEMNRALSGAAPSGFVSPVYVVTKQNIDTEGGSQNTFDPSNSYKAEYEKIWGVQ